MAELPVSDQLFDKLQVLAWRNKQSMEEVIDDLLTASSAPPPAETRAGTFEELFNSSPDMQCVSDSDGHFLSVNPSFERVLGYSQDELSLMSMTDPIHPDDIDTSIAAMRQLDTGHDAVQFTNQYRCKDGSYKWLLWTSHATKNRSQIVSIIRDITDQKQTEDQLVYQANVLGHVSDAIISTDPDFLIQSWNKAAERIYGWKAEEVIGKPIRDILGSTYFEDSDSNRARATLFNRGYWSGEATQRRKDDTHVEIMSSVSLLRDKAGIPLGMVGANRDITERKQAEEALQQYNRRLEILREIDLAILQSKSVEEIAQVTLTHIHKLIPYYRVNMMVFDDPPEDVLVISGDASEVTVSHSNKAHQRENLDFYEQFTSHYRDQLRQGEIIQVDDISAIADPSAIERWLLERGGLAYLTIPLLLQNRLTGMLTLVMKEANTITSDQVDAILEVKEALTTAIQQSRLFMAERDQRLLAEALHDTAAVLNSSLDLDTVLEHLIEQVVSIVPADSANFSLIEGDKARVVEVWNDNTQGHQLMGTRFAYRDFHHFVRMLTDNTSCLIADTQTDPDWVQHPKTSWVRSYLGVPIQALNEVIGFLNLDSFTPNNFTPEHANRLKAFANQAGIAIQNARLYDETQRSLQELNALYNATSVLFSAENVNDLTHHITETVVTEFKHAECGIILVDQETKALIRGARIASGDHRIDTHAALHIDGPGLVPYAIRNEQSIYAPDVSLNPHYVNNDPGRNVSL